MKARIYEWLLWGFVILLFLLGVAIVHVHAQPIVFIVPPGQVLQMDVTKDANDNTIVTVYNPPAVPLPPPPPVFSATLCPVADVTGHYVAGADGEMDTCIVASNLKSTPVAATIQSNSGGGWQTAPSNYYYHIVISGNKFYFSPYPSTRYHLKVFYNDGSTDETDV
jgi:hypothetical protein